MHPLTYFIKSKFPNFPTKKVIYVEIAISIPRLKMSDDNARIIIRFYRPVICTKVLRIQIRHNTDDAPNLLSSDWWMRMSTNPFILFEVKPENPKFLFQAV